MHRLACHVLFHQFSLLRALVCVECAGDLTLALSVPSPRGRTTVSQGFRAIATSPACSNLCITLEAVWSRRRIYAGIPHRLEQQDFSCMEFASDLRESVNIASAFPWPKVPVFSTVFPHRVP